MFAVCLIGGKSSDGKAEFNYTFEQLDELRSYIKRKCAQYGITEVIVWGVFSLSRISALFRSGDSRYKLMAV